MQRQHFRQVTAAACSSDHFSGPFCTAYTAVALAKTLLLQGRDGCTLRNPGVDCLGLALRLLLGLLLRYRPRSQPRILGRAVGLFGSWVWIEKD